MEAVYGFHRIIYCDFTFDRTVTTVATPLDASSGTGGVCVCEDSSVHPWRSCVLRSFHSAARYVGG